MFWERAAEEAADAAEERWSRADEVIRAIEWAVTRDPNKGEPLNESGTLRVFTYPGARSIDQPTAVVTYEVQELNIIFHDVEFTEAEYGQAGRA